MKISLSFLMFSLSLPFTTLAQDIVPSPENIEVHDKHYSRYAGRNFPTKVLWGDTHLHTSNSWMHAPSV